MSPTPLPPTTATGTGASSSTHSPEKRPPLAHRQSSTSSQVSRSLSEASSTHSGSHHPHTHQHQHTRQHKAGRHHGRLGARNTSFGHNLNKLAHGHASTARMPYDSGMTSIPGTPTSGAAAARPTNFVATVARPQHLRSRSGDSSTGADDTVTTPTSPRVSQPHMKRNASAFIVSRNHSHTALKKNHSSGHLPRNLSGKALSKAAQPNHRMPPRRKHSGRSEKSVPASPVSPGPRELPTVRFALADEENDSEEADEEENEWTEESASVSPNVTRDNTQQNSAVLDPDKAPNKEAEHAAHEFTSGDESTSTVIHAPEGRSADADAERCRAEKASIGRQEATATAAGIEHINGESSYRLSARPPTLDADAITSRLLQRKVTPSLNAEPQVSSVSAIVQPDANDHRSLSHSQASTLADGTPGRDLVSRFVNVNSNEGTPRDGNMLPRKGVNAAKENDLDASKRNKSAPNMAAVDKGPISPTQAKPRRSGTDTPTDLPPSRTQQKLFLQRASSVIEPQKHIPAVLPRPGAAQLLGHGLSFASADGGTSAQVHALFAQISKEYNVVRRYRNPVADAVARGREFPRRERKSQHARKPSQRAVLDEEGGGVPLDGHESPLESFKAQQQHDERARASRHHHNHNHDQHEQQADRRVVAPRKEDKGHRSRVSFDLPTSVKTDETDEEEGGSAGTPMRTGRPSRRDEAYELCRRMWEMGEPEGVAG